MRRLRYLDNMVASARVTGDLEPLEMAALRTLMRAHDDGTVKLVTSSESHREQERPKTSSLAPPSRLREVRCHVGGRRRFFARRRAIFSRFQARRHSMHSRLPRLVMRRFGPERGWP